MPAQNQFVMNNSWSLDTGMIFGALNCIVISTARSPQFHLVILIRRFRAIKHIVDKIPHWSRSTSVSEMFRPFFHWCVCFFSYPLPDESVRLRSNESFRLWEFEIVVRRRSQLTPFPPPPFLLGSQCLLLFVVVDYGDVETTCSVHQQNQSELIVNI